MNVACIAVLAQAGFAPVSGARMVARRAARGRAAIGASHARLMPFQRSMIYMGSIAGMTMSDIVGKVQKSDGSFPSVRVAWRNADRLSSPSERLRAANPRQN